MPIDLLIFSRKAYSKVDFGYTKISDAIFLGQSLLLSTTVLNDKPLATRLLLCMHVPMYENTYNL